MVRLEGSGVAVPASRDRRAPLWFGRGVAAAGMFMVSVGFIQAFGDAGALMMLGGGVAFIGHRTLKDVEAMAARRRG